MLYNRLYAYFSCLHIFRQRRIAARRVKIDSHINFPVMHLSMNYSITIYNTVYIIWYIYGTIYNTV